MKNKILLLNPPSNKNLQRDFLCSASSKADYYWPPIDFVVLSGILKEFNLSLIDAIADKTPIAKILEHIKKREITYVISLVSAIDFDNEIKILETIKQFNNKIKIIVIGDIAFFEREKVISMRSIDAIILDFTTPEIIKYILNSNNDKIKDIIYKIDKKIIFNGVEKRKKFSYGGADFSIFNLNKYSIPYAIYHPIAPILMNYGCPYKCEFCASGRIGYRIREIEETKKEIKRISDQGFKELFIRDFNFTTNRAFVIEICNFIIKNNIKIIWSCEARVDNVNREMLNLMKLAGCYLIFFGVEVASQNKLEELEKNTSLTQIKEVFSYCKRIGIKTLASFILALPGDTREDIIATINFAKQIDTDYASFNLYVPRYGSVLREKIKKEGKIVLDNKFDSSSEFNNLTNISDKEIIKLYKKAIRGFYFRPKYLLNKLSEIRTFYQFKNHLNNGVSLFKKIIK
jgi:anaerobic magnesium-protoporphyrin IX monomethyl ester cyclase